MEGKGTYKWYRVDQWPVSSPGMWLGLPPELLPEVRKCFDSGYVIERHAPSPRFGATEIRIPCRRGEIHPVAPGTWAWSGTGGRWSRRVVRVVGTEATGPWDSSISHGTKDDEAVIWFPSKFLQVVGAETGARKRRSTWKAARPEYLCPNFQKRETGVTMK